MTQGVRKVKDIAPLTNVAILLTAATQVQSYCQEACEGWFLVFHGHAGYGKSAACNYVRSKLRGYRVECCKHWTPKTLMRALLFEMSIPWEKKGIDDMFNDAVAQLRASGRPLLIDEADHLAKDSLIELVRNLMDKSRAAVILVGEEMLPNKLKKWERVDSRVLESKAAQPSDMDDIRLLADLYCPNIDIADDWLEALYQKTGGNTRRVVANLNNARTEAAYLPLIDLESWGDRPWHTSSRPLPRKPV